MAKFQGFAITVFTFAFAFTAAAGSILNVEGGVYSRVTARFDGNAVPKQHCRRAIKNLQVSSSNVCPSSLTRVLADLHLPALNIFLWTILYDDCFSAKTQSSCAKYSMTIYHIELN